MTTAPLADFDASRAWALSSEVSLRDEEFGALAYHHGTRRLVFLKSRELVALVRALDSFTCVNDALAAHVDAPQRARYREALAALHRSDLLRVR